MTRLDPVNPNARGAAVYFYGEAPFSRSGARVEELPIVPESVVTALRRAASA